jgi:hypothetical protein
MELVAALVLWIGLALAGGAIASSKGRSGFFYFVLSLLLPLIGIILVIGLSDRRRAVPARQGDGRPRRPCPECAELVLASARKCPHCAAALTPVRWSWLKSMVWGPLEPKR